MLKRLIRRTTAICAFATLAIPTTAQDLIARQAPVDKKMRAIDSVAIQRLIQQEIIQDTEIDDELYPDWENSGINLYSNVELPKDYKIDLRHFCMPTTNRIVTSNYGYRRRFRRQHKGLDINAYMGDTIRAAFDGKVRVVDNQPGGYGNVVVIRHNNGLETVYGHLSRHLTAEGKTVKAGTPIGLAGRTGRSTGVHLHFETRLLGEYIDPAKLFDFEAQDVTGDFYVFRGRGHGTLIGSHSGRRNAGQELAANTTATSAEEEEVSYNSSEDAAAPAGKAKSSARTRFHKVRRGETLYSIAKKHGTTVANLCRINGLSKRSKLRAGQVIKYS